MYRFRKMNRLFFGLIFFSFTCILPGQSEDTWAYQHYSMANGLSHPWVNDFLQDRQGFLWLATSAGLNRFDGYEFKVYANNPTDSLSLSCVNVLSLAEAPDGDIWVGTAEGVFVFDPGREAFHRLSLAKGAVDYTRGKIVDDILFAPDGDVWLALIDGLARWEPEKKRLQFYPGTTYPEPRWQGRQAQHLQFDHPPAVTSPKALLPFFYHNENHRKTSESIAGTERTYWVGAPLFPGADFFHPKIRPDEISNASICSIDYSSGYIERHRSGAFHRSLFPGQTPHPG